jgi:hypothetical protein
MEMGLDERVDTRKTMLDAYCTTVSLLSDDCPLWVSARKKRRVSTVDA